MVAGEQGEHAVENEVEVETPTRGGSVVTIALVVTEYASCVSTTVR